MSFVRGAVAAGIIGLGAGAAGPVVGENIGGPFQGDLQAISTISGELPEGAANMPPTGTIEVDDPRTVAEAAQTLGPTLLFEGEAIEVRTPDGAAGETAFLPGVDAETAQRIGAPVVRSRLDRLKGMIDNDARWYYGSRSALAVGAIALGAAAVKALGGVARNRFGSGGSSTS